MSHMTYNPNVWDVSITPIYRVQPQAVCSQSCFKQYPTLMPDLSGYRCGRLYLVVDSVYVRARSSLISSSTFL